MNGPHLDFDLEKATLLLARTPGTLHALLDGLPERWTRADEGPDTFSPFDVVGHLIDGEETDWIPRAKLILAQGPEPRFEAYDRFRHRARNAGRSLSSLLNEFAHVAALGVEQRALVFFQEGGELSNVGRVGGDGQRRKTLFDLEIVAESVEDP